MLRFVMGMIVLLLFAAGAQRANDGFSAPARDSETTERALRAIAEQSDDQFAYDVTSRVLERSVDANRFLDSLLLALIAAQSAIFAILVDKFTDYRAFVVAGMLGAGTVAGIAVLLTLSVQEAPRGTDFLDLFPDDPSGTRRSYADRFVRDADQNERVRFWKTALFFIALVLTLAVSVAAAVEKAVQLPRGMT